MARQIKTFKVNKIGIDLDYVDEKDLIQWKTKTLFPFRKLFSNYDIFRSSSGKGYHIELYLIEEISVTESFRLRKTLKDDLKRLKFSEEDYLRGWDFDILFTYKRVGGVWRKRKLIEKVTYL